MKKTLGIIGGLLLVVVLLYSGFLYFSNNLIIGGGGSQQYAPDTVQAGEPAEVTLIVTATGGGGNIQGRFSDMTLHYRLVSETEYGVAQPQAITLPENFQSVQSDTFQSEAYTFMIPPYPETTTGEIEYYIELSFDGYQSRQEGVKKIKIVSTPTQTLEGKIAALGAPIAILADPNDGVNLLLQSRECNKTYVIERSYNQRDWETVRTTTFHEYQSDAATTCPKDSIDSNIVSGTKKLWYRYGLLNERGDVTVWSEIGEVTLEEYEY